MPIIRVRLFTPPPRWIRGHSPRSVGEKTKRVGGSSVDQLRDFVILGLLLPNLRFSMHLRFTVTAACILFAKHILENDSNLQMTTARRADKRADRHVDICWPSLTAVDAETILANADNFTQQSQRLIVFYFSLRRRHH